MLIYIRSFNEDFCPSADFQHLHDVSHSATSCFPSCLKVHIFGAMTAMVSRAISTTGRQWLQVSVVFWGATKNEKKSCLSIRVIGTKVSESAGVVQKKLRANRGSFTMKMSMRQAREKKFQVRWNIFSLLNKSTIKHSLRKAYVWTIQCRQDSQCKSAKVHCFHYIADGLYQLKSCPLCIISPDQGGKPIRLHALLIANETAIKTTSNWILELSGSF